MSEGVVDLAIAADHPAFAGHFPGMPLVPGVVLLDEALHAIGTALGADLARCRLGTVKFLNPVRPGEAVQAHYEARDGGVRFELTSDGRKVASASLRMPADGRGQR